ncbi:MAG TPA: NAD(P)-dependent oxidoreductase [Paracoccaceae bacterium]|nr:NAD(P)-dependent oxidoreductase [Paracoccaceae bacterium]
MAKVAFLGLGVMGFPMAGHLAAKGHEVTVYNRTAAKAEAWIKQHGGRMGATPREAASGADFVMVCVGNDDDLRSVIIGEDGALAGMGAGAILVDHTTASANVARELHGIAAVKGIGFVDAPVSGGQAGAENGQLAIMCGGEEEVFAKAEPVMQAYGKSIRRLGPVGAGQLTKMVNQICIAGLVQGLSEALNFAVKAGLDGEQVIEAISGGAAGSWQMVNRHKTMLAGEYDHGFAIDWMRKDLGIALDEAKENGARLPVTALIDQFYGEVQDMGGGRWDTSALLKRLQR